LGVLFPKLDGTFNPSLIYGEGNIFNFGYVRIEDEREYDDNGKPHLIAEIQDELIYCTSGFNAGFNTSVVRHP
jgi:hypothetical protein